MTLDSDNREWYEEILESYIADVQENIEKCLSQTTHYCAICCALIRFINKRTNNISGNKQRFLAHINLAWSVNEKIGKVED